MRALDDFVTGGGTLVCLNGSSQFAIDELRLPVENAATGIPGDEFSISGSILEIVTDGSHPVMAGMPSRAPVFFSRSPVFRPTEGFEGVVLAKHVEVGSPLLSGFLLGEEHLHGHAAALDVHHGQGHVILLGLQASMAGPAVRKCPDHVERRFVLRPPRRRGPGDAGVLDAAFLRGRRRITSLSSFDSLPSAQPPSPPRPLLR